MGWDYCDDVCSDFKVKCASDIKKFIAVPSRCTSK